MIPGASAPDLELRPAIRLGMSVAGTIRMQPRETFAPPSPPTLQDDSYGAVVTALARGEATALPRLNGLADAGDSQAQLNLASLYETGGSGLSRDMSAARLWTRRAAEAGERIAMHNLALFLMRGEGGAQNFDEAAVWFRRASDRGVVDSQFNLAQLYETGRGVDRNLREAYRWYLVAANAGDGASRERAIELEGRVSPGERAMLEGKAAAFQPGGATEFDPAVIVPPAETVAETQTLLARQGYFVGPVDGVVSPAFRTAVAAYLRDHPGATAEVAPIR